MICAVPEAALRTALANAGELGCLTCSRLFHEHSPEQFYDCERAEQESDRLDELRQQLAWGAP